MNKKHRYSTMAGLIGLSMLALPTNLYAQDNAVNEPVVLYGQPRRLVIGDIKVDCESTYEDYVLIGISGLNVGDAVSIPGEEITEAVKRYWKHGLFSNVSIIADEIRNDSVFLRIKLNIRPKVSQINVNGVKKSEADEILSKIGIIKGNQLTPI